MRVLITEEIGRDVDFFEFDHDEATLMDVYYEIYKEYLFKQYSSSQLERVFELACERTSAGLQSRSEGNPGATRILKVESHASKEVFATLLAQCCIEDMERRNDRNVVREIVQGAGISSHAASFSRIMEEALSRPSRSPSSANLSKAVSVEAERPHYQLVFWSSVPLSKRPKLAII